MLQENLTQEKKIELRTRWSLEAEATVQPQGMPFTPLSLGMWSHEIAQTMVLLCSPLGLRGRWPVIPHVCVLVCQ